MSPSEKRKLQKNFYYASEEEKLQLEKMLADDAVFNDQSISTRILQCIRNQMLTGNQQADCWIRDLYASDPIGFSPVQDALLGMAGYLSGATNRTAMQNALALIDYCRKHGQRNDQINSDDNYFNYYYRQVGYLADSLNRIAEIEYEPGHKEAKEAHIITDLHHDAYELNRIAKESEDNCIYFDSVMFVYGVLSARYEYICNSSYTFRLLFALVKIHIWPDTSQNRMDLLSIIRQITPIWFKQ